MKKEIAWGFVIILGVLITLGVNYLAYILKRTFFFKDDIWMIYLEYILSSFSLLLGLILVIGFKIRTTGWVFIVGGLLNMFVWIWFIHLLIQG